MLVSGQLLGMYAGARLAFVARSWINQQSLWRMARPTVAFPVVRRHHLLLGTKLYRLITEARGVNNLPDVRGAEWNS